MSLPIPVAAPPQPPAPRRASRRPSGLRPLPLLGSVHLDSALPRSALARRGVPTLLGLVTLLALLLLAPELARADQLYWLDRPSPAQVATLRDAAPQANLRVFPDFLLVVLPDGAPAPGLPSLEAVALPTGTTPYLVDLHNGGAGPSGAGPAEAGRLEVDPSSADRSRADRRSTTPSGSEAAGSPRILRRGRDFALVAVAWGSLDSAGAGACRGEALHYVAPLATRALRAQLGALAPTDSTVRADIASAVDGAAIHDIIAELSGAAPFELAGQTLTNNDRNTFRPGSDIAADYLEDRFKALGYQVVRQTFDLPAPFVATTQNIVAVKPGTTRADEIVVIGAHYDTISSRDNRNGPAPGAEDNGRGTATVLHLARIFTHYDTERTIHFVAFGGEEQGLHGSRRYVELAGQAGDNVVGALRLDMVSAYTTRFQIDIEGLHVADIESLMNLFNGNVQAVSPNLGTIQKFFSFGSDHVPFQNAGIPAFLAIESDYSAYPGYHRTTDTLEKLTPALGADVARAMAVTLADLTHPTRTGVPVLVSAFRAEPDADGVSLRWDVMPAPDLAGFLVLRGRGNGGFRLLTPAALPATAGTMHYRDPLRGIDGFDGVEETVRLRYALEVLLTTGARERLPQEAVVEVTARARGLRLAQNHPNPFNPSTTIDFTLPRTMHVTLRILDSRGRQVVRLLDADQAPGHHIVRWDGRDARGLPVASGTYTYELRGAGRVRARHMLLVR